ncbi:MAG: tetratricopeptide repeat protein [Burkholderiales bacterium]|nr:tetratricopeptide repeat protein [Burkholderiales bacterium]
MRLFDRLLRRAGRAPGAMPGRGAGDTGASRQNAPVGGNDSDPCAEGERLLALGSPQQALNAFQAALDGAADHAQAHVGEARAYLALSRTEEACESLEIALAVEPGCIPALQLLGRLRREGDRPREAIDLLARAVILAPERADLRFDLALALNRAQRPEEAAQAYRDAIERDPRNPAPRINLGLMYLQQFGDPVAAETHFRHALQIEPGHVVAMANLGLSLHDQHRCDEAIALYREGLHQHPEHVELRWNEGLAHLSLGDYARGWPGYEMRFMRSGGRKLDRFPYPQWDGQALADAKLLVVGEQGIGDEIMFASCLTDLSDRVGGVVLECAPRLERLFMRSFGGIAVHGKERGVPIDWLRQYPEIGAKTAIGSLPRFLRCSREAFPTHRGYLIADPERVGSFRHRLRAAGPELTVGISWRGGTSGTRGPMRSIAVEQLRPLFAVPNTRFVSLQHALRPDEREQVRAAGMAVWDGAGDDMDDTAALVSALDLTITVANTNAHLAGGLGRPAWVLLNESPDWRWLCAGEASPWYPSLRLFRSDGRPRWSALIASLAQRLTAVASGPASDFA